jgi:hypothetical protein
VPGSLAAIGTFLPSGSQDLTAIIHFVSINSVSNIRFKKKKLKESETKEVQVRR